ncbi:TIGR01458 family HAD-type hydrolase [Teredinibacter haidensis]|uniref:TIGR01458 family HAD-type hydrolase n=1 Tax=Teredinibacter haidensis TaxID=2731755 RepID=UPI000AEEC1F5|nr:TIGR01458 family HAD-type hydrolase [Teredinibacter haidensis]
MTPGCKALLLDLSGVLYDGNIAIEGAADIVAKARRLGLVIRFVTNTASKSSAEIITGLQRMGIVVPEDELFTAPLAAKRYVVEEQLRPYILLHSSVISEFSDVPQSEPNCVVLGDARSDLNYENLNRAFQLCHAGAPLIAVGMNKFFQTESGLQLDAGGFVHAIEWAAGCDVIVMGKPSIEFFKQVVASTGFAAGECLMVGDDVDSDVLGALAAGLQACLVKTGKYQQGDEELLPKGARVVDSIDDLFN